MADYKLTPSPSVVIRTSDNVSIPDDPANRDWRQYQEWLDEGNTPDPPDPYEPGGGAVFTAPPPTTRQRRETKTRKPQRRRR